MRIQGPKRTCYYPSLKSPKLGTDTHISPPREKEGFEQVAAAFLDTDDNEKEHAKIFSKLLAGGQLEISGAFPAGIIGDTKINLKAVADGEMFENITYPGFADIAEEEGFPAIAKTFRLISVAEKGHENRYRVLLKNIEDGTTFRRSKKVF